jgi:hypothetical protein
MIIFGTRVRHKTIGEGEFFCPKCQATSRYIHKQAIRSFTLYFIPLFPIQRLGEFIECQGCGITFKPEIRHMRGMPARRTTGENLGKLMSTMKSRLDGGYPIEYMIRDLTAAGLDLGVARGAVDGAIGPERKTCDKCGLAYSSQASNCTGCGGPLR